MFIVCPGMIINGLFLYSWKVLPNLLKQKFNFANKSLTLLLILTVVISYSFWLITASLLVLFYHWVSLSNDVFEGQDISPWLVITSFPHAYTFIISTLSLLLHLLLGVYGCWHSQPRPKSQTKAAMWVNFVRFFAAGLSIFVAVYLGSLDVTVGAIASLFPAIFGTAMISVWLTSGTAVSLGAVEPLILGCLSVSVYAYLSAFLVPLLHIRTNLWTAIILGSIICYLVSICLVSYPSFLFIRSRTMLNVEVASNMTIVLVDSNENNDPELVTK
ncbi:hypothetical protein BC833DRAFT_613097 [Globomyces pollinis-pini]|nr:hypothetical protein BC833DRAFT_613097 [Globomyces pollinis-pini]